MLRDFLPVVHNLSLQSERNVNPDFSSAQVITLHQSVGQPVRRSVTQTQSIVTINIPRPTRCRIRSNRCTETHQRRGRTESDIDRSLGFRFLNGGNARAPGLRLRESSSESDPTGTSVNTRVRAGPTHSSKLPHQHTHRVRHVRPRAHQSSRRAHRVPLVSPQLTSSSNCNSG